MVDVVFLLVRVRMGGNAACPAVYALHRGCGLIRH